MALDIPQPARSRTSVRGIQSQRDGRGYSGVRNIWGMLSKARTGLHRMLFQCHVQCRGVQVILGLVGSWVCDGVHASCNGQDKVVC